MREIKIDLKNYEEVKIGDKVYQLDISNEALERYATKFKLLQIKISAMTSSDNLNFNTIKDALKEVINGMYLNEPYDEISAAFGGNMIALTQVFIHTVDIFKDVMKIR